MLPKSAHAKGKLLEDFICDKLIESGLDIKATRVLGSGNGNKLKTDINTSIMIGDRTLGIEAKNHKVPHMVDWWNQTIKLEKLNYFPALVYKLEGEQYEKAKVVIYLNDFLEILQMLKGCRFIEEDKENGVFIAKKDEYKIKKAIDSLKDILKVIDK